MRAAYVEKLKTELKMESLSPQLPSNVQHECKCLICLDSFTAVPKDKVSKFKKHSKPGCTKCIRLDIHSSSTEANLEKLSNLGFELLEDYKGLSVSILLRKIDCCGRSWLSRPHNIIQKNPTCKPCRDDDKRERMLAKEVRQQYVGRMKPDYLEWLENEVKLKIIEPICTSNDHHDIQCLLCDSIFNATPKAKVQQFKQNGRVGCPTCTSTDRYRFSVEYNKQKLANSGYKLLEEYTSTSAVILMMNINCCSRPFSARTNNVLNGATICPPCNDERKRKAFQQFNIDKHESGLEHMEGFQRYSKLVRVLTEQTYRDHHTTINPNNLIRMRSGPDGYHLDHIYSIYNCYHDGIPEELCADVANLQMLKSFENAQKYNKITQAIPDIFESYLQPQ